MDQEARRPAPAAEVDHEVARLLGDPAPGRVAGAAGEAHAPRVPSSMKNEHVEAPQPDRVDGEEVAGDHARACWRRNSRQVGPARRGAGGIRPRLSTERTVRRRDAHPELAQLAGDPLVAPARVLAREPQDQLLEFRVERRPTEPARCVRPAARAPAGDASAAASSG